MSRVQIVDRTSPPTSCMPEPGELAWHVLRAPMKNLIYRGHWPHVPTPHIHLLGFQVADMDWVLLSDSTADHRPRPLAADPSAARMHTPP
jgi:hypothetical protein